MSNNRQYFPWRFPFEIALHQPTITYFAYSFEKFNEMIS